MKTKTALFLGRFQPFHLGHLWVAKTLSKIHDEVVIIIGTHQKGKARNPFTFSERKKMIRMVLKKAGIENYRIKSIPDYPSDAEWIRKIKKISPKGAVMFSGNDYIINLFRKNKLPVKRIKIYKGISADKVRRLIRQNKNWEKYVDNVIGSFLKKNKLLKKVRKHP